MPVRLLPMMMLLLILSLLTGCRTSGPSVGEVRDRDMLDRFFDDSAVFNQSITGFALYDPESETMLHERDAHRFFTPASNTKIFTLYTALKTLPDTLPSLRYTVRNDTLYFRGTGDPPFLNPLFPDNGVYEFLKNREEVLVYYDGHYDDGHFGAGWSWDWHSAPYAPEKSPFPVYGNMVRLQAQQVALVMLNEDEPVKPAYFEKYLEPKGWNSSQVPLVDRELRENRFTYAPRADTARQERQIPFVYSPGLLVDILSDTLSRDVHYAESGNVPEFENTFFNTPADTLYRRMMLMSDNLVGEQLLLMISDHLFNRMGSDRVIGYAVNEFLTDLPDTPRWADGSGLTRYNLMTPRSYITLLDKLYDEFGEQRILPMFPAGGETGTISSSYRPPENAPPFVYAKTGTLRNNQILSGYVFTDSGKRLIFSFMNNNVVVSAGSIQSEMEKVLNLIRENY